MACESKIIQWNANGLELRKKCGELERLLTNHTPMCVCIQHTGNVTNIKNYKLASESTRANGELGTSIFVHNSITYENLDLNEHHFQPSSITLYVPGKGKIKIFKVLIRRHPPLGMFKLSASTLNQN